MISGAVQPWGTVRVSVELKTTRTHRLEATTEAAEFSREEGHILLDRFIRDAHKLLNEHIRMIREKRRSGHD